MRRSNLVIGLGLSAVLHGALLVVLISGPATPAPAPPPRPVAAPVQIARVDPAEQVPLEPAPEPVTETPQLVPLATDPAPAAPPPPPPQTAPPRPLAERVSPAPTHVPGAITRPSPPAARPEPLPSLAASEMPASPAEATPEPVREPAPAPPETLAGVYETLDEPEGGRMPGDGDAETVPPLRVHWQDAGELISVARALGMRLAAVDAAGRIVAEVALDDTPTLKEWTGLPPGYSNRVRMLSPSIFSSRLRPDIREIWVFVPADRDRAMAEAQRLAVRRAGGSAEDVVAVDGRFVRAANGSYRLDITSIRWREGSRG